jgi:hypothetical protein
LPENDKEKLKYKKKKKKNRKFPDADWPTNFVPWQSQNFLLYYQTSSCAPCQLHLLVADRLGFGSEKRIKILHMLEQIEHQKQIKCIICGLTRLCAHQSVG